MLALIFWFVVGLLIGWNTKMPQFVKDLPQTIKDKIKESQNK